MPHLHYIENRSGKLARTAAGSLALPIMPVSIDTLAATTSFAIWSPFHAKREIRAALSKPYESVI